MDRPRPLLELIALRLSSAGPDNEPTSGMATLLSPEFAVTTLRVIQDKGSEVVLHFDLWPESFSVPARIVLGDEDTDLAILKLEGKLPSQLPPLIDFVRDLTAVQGQRWESLLLTSSPRFRTRLMGPIDSGEEGGRILVSDDDVPPHAGLVGAPVVVNNALFGIIAHHTIEPMPPPGSNKTHGLRLTAILSDAIDRVYKRVTQEQETSGSSSRASGSMSINAPAGTIVIGADPPVATTSTPVPAPEPDSDIDLAALFKRLSKASRRALEHAEGIQSKMGRGKVHTEQLIAGLYQKKDGELRSLMRTANVDEKDLFGILDKQARRKLPRLPEYEPVSLSALPPLSQHVEEGLINAHKAADEDKSEAINNWHLLYGVLSVEDCDLAMTLRARGLEKEKVRRGPSPERTGAPGTARPNIAGFSSDDPRQGTDRFGITREVKALCSVLAAKSVEPPLSLGLFGDWGSGKSFFMGQMEKEFIRLREKARADKDSPYCPNIVQLWFNAWHYMDMNLWASLASEIFEGLADELAKDEKLDVGKTDPKTARARLLAATASKKDVLVDAERRKSFAETELKVSEEHLSRLKEADAELADNLTFTEISRAAYRFVANQPDVRANIESAGAALNLSQAQRVASETKAELLELKGLLGSAKALYLAIRNDKSRWVWFTLLVCVALVLVAIPLLLQYKDQLAGLRGVVTTVAVGLSGLMVAVSPYLAGVRKALKLVGSARAEKDVLINQKRDERRQALEQQQTQVRRRLLEATQRVQEASDEVKQLEQQLDELRADRQMANFIKQRHESSDYINQLGTIARARNDFEKLSNLLAKVREQTRAEAEAAQKQDAQAEAGPNAEMTSGRSAEENLLLPRIDRIVLYIDDLDRCPEGKVVEVLQAVHLLLAFPLFVVIVGVDPRWLLHSLKQHSKVFQSPREAGNGDSDEEERHWQSTPLNYLEKIFQIPFTLRPMAYDGFGDFIEDLASPRSDEGKKGAIDKGAGAPNKSGSPGNQTGPIQPAVDPAADKPTTLGDQQPATGTTDVVEGGLPEQIADQPSQAAEQEQKADANSHAHKEAEPDVEDELPPEHLRIEDWERQYMKHLFWLIPSPRAAKRFVNIYRLLRASVPEEKRVAFVGDSEQGQHRYALMLLAIVTGYPNEAADILRELLQQDESRTWWQFIDEFETRSRPQTELDQRDPRTVAGAETNVGDREGNPEGELSEAQAENMRQLFKNLGEVRELIPEHQSCADFIWWAPHVARYSFQSGRVVLAQRDAEGGEDD